MKLWELKDKLKVLMDEYDGETEIVILDSKGNTYTFGSVTNDYRDSKPKLALKLDIENK